MAQGKILTVAVLCGFFICTTAAAHAKEAKQSAKKSFQTGLQLFKAEEYELALPHFEKAVTLSKRRPSAVLALAQCQRILKMYAAALKHFREYLAGKPNPKKVGQIQETIEVVELLVKRAEVDAQKAKVETAAKEAESLRLIDATRRAEEAAKAAQAAALVAQASPLPVEVKSDVWLNPVFWIVTGVFAAGTAITLGVVYGSDEDHYGGSTGVVANPLMRF